MNYTRLTAEDREIISQLIAQDESLPTIAKRLNRSTSTISRELARNRSAGKPYKAFHAQEFTWREANGGLGGKPVGFFSIQSGQTIIITERGIELTIQEK